MSASLRRRLDALEAPSAAMSINISELLRQGRERCLARVYALGPEELEAEQASERAERVAALRAREAAGLLSGLEYQMLEGLERVMAADARRGAA